jgi:hypothetical protein
LKVLVLLLYELLREQSRIAAKRAFSNALLKMLCGTGIVTCRVPCDHIPRRSWPLFKARAVLAGLLASLSLENKP